MLQGLRVEPNPLESVHKEELRTVYEDGSLWVVDKPSGMLSAPGKVGGVSVAEIARRRFPEASGLMVGHRLDMHTSGLLVVAKTRGAFVALRHQFEAKEVEKTYTALLDGNVASDEGSISRCRPTGTTVRGRRWIMPTARRRSRFIGCWGVAAA